MMITTLQEDKTWRLEKFNVLKELPIDEKLYLSEMAYKKKFLRGEKVYLPSKPAKHVYFINEGFIRVSRIMESGEEGLVEVMGPGEIFGNYSPMEYEEKNEMAIALNDTTLFFLDKDIWERIFERDPEFSRSILRVAGQRLRRLQTRIEQLQYLSASARISKVLKELADYYGRKIGAGFEIELKLNLIHMDIAKLAGTARQSVTTELRELQEKGIISYDRRRILIREYGKL